MTDEGTARLLEIGGRQVVCLPKDFRLTGRKVRFRRIGRALLLEPIAPTAKEIRAVFAEIDRLGGADFLKAN